MRHLAANMAFVALLLAPGGTAAAQTQAVATVDGNILSSDGSRILYIPTGNPGQVRIRASDGSETVINPGPQFTPLYGFLTPTGAAFTADVQGVIGDALFNFNIGGLSRVGTLNASESLRVDGRYAVFSGSTAPNVVFPNFVFRLDTTTGLLAQAPGDNGNIELDVTAGGSIAYWTSNGYSRPGDPSVDYNIEMFDGTSVRRITNILGPIFNFYPRTDGSLVLFVREQVCCRTAFSRLILTDGSTEILLRDGGQRPSTDRDYQINGGWVAFRAEDNSLHLRSPSGSMIDLGTSTSILSVSEFGEVAYRIGQQTFLRTADGGVWEIGAYGFAFNVGRDWYFYRAGELVRFADGLMVALNADFAAGANPFTARDGATLFGVADIVVPRSIVVQGGTTVDTRGFDIALTGPISGPGGIQVVGGGLLTLRGANSFAGGIGISASGRLAGDTISLSGSIANAGELIFDQDFDGSFSGSLSGSGLLRKTGSGTVVLGGNQAFTGTTRIEGGGLHVDGIDTPSPFVVSAGLLSGTGRIGALNVTNGAVSPGGGIGTLNVTGSLTLGAGSLYAAELTANGASDRLAAGGAASLSGGSLHLHFAPERYRIGTRWRILQAGSLSGTFSNVEIVGQLGLLDSRISYNADSVDVSLTLNQQRFFSLAGAGNQRATAGALATFPASSDLLNELIWLPQQQIPATLDQLSGELHATSLATLFDSGRSGRTATLRRLQGLREGQANGVWGTATVARTRYDGQNNLAESRTNIRDFAAGGDRALSSSVRLGAAVSFGESDLTSDGRGTLSDTHIGAIVYGQVKAGPTIVRGGAGLTRHALESERRVAFGTIDDTLRNESDGWSNEFFAEAALPVVTGGVHLEPFAGVTSRTIRLSDLQENGGEAAVSSPSLTSSRSVGVIGARAYADRHLGRRSMFVRGELAWEHELDAGDHERTLAFAPAPGAPYIIEGLRTAQDSASIRLGVGLDEGRWRIELSYDGVIAGSQNSHIGSAALSLSF